MLHRHLLRCGWTVVAACIAACACASSPPSQLGGAARAAPELARALRAEKPVAPRVWSYDVVAAPRAAELVVRAKFPPGVPAWMGVDRFAHPYLRSLTLRTKAGSRQVSARGRHWYVPECRQSGCELEYRYELARAATDIDRFGFAGFRGGALLAPPSTWLLHPRSYSGSDRYRFRVTTAPGETFASGVFSSGRSAQTSFEAPASLLFEAPYSGFGEFTSDRLEVGAAAVRLYVGAGTTQPAEALRAWVERGARLVTEYYGRFPLREAAVMVLPAPGDGISGMQLGNGGASILLFVGEDVEAAALSDDWIVVHEMFHLGFPTLERRHLWFAEGLATYQEPIARARAGLIGEEELWYSFVRGMPLGLPRQGDRGLDGSSSWARVYWGGALFSLLADVSLRSATNNRLSLDVAARAIQRSGGDTSRRWTIEQTLAAADRALGTRTFRDLHAAHGRGAPRVDLPELWRRLGVRRAGERIVLDDAAEWAHVRRAISGSAPREVAFRP